MNFTDRTDKHNNIEMEREKPRKIVEHGLPGSGAVENILPRYTHLDIKRIQPQPTERIHQHIEKNVDDGLW